MSLIVNSIFDLLNNTEKEIPAKVIRKGKSRNKCGTKSLSVPEITL